MSLLYLFVAILCIGLYLAATWNIPKVRVFVHGVEYRCNRHVWYENVVWKTMDFTTPMSIGKKDEITIIYESKQSN